MDIVDFVIKYIKLIKVVNINLNNKSLLIIKYRLINFLFYIFNNKLFTI